MSDDLQTPERGTEQASEGLPIPTLETPSSTTPSGVDIAAIKKQVAEELRKELRMAQSTKDKNAELVRKTLGINDLSELEEMGVKIPDNVKLEYRLRGMEQGRPTEQTHSQSTSSGGTGDVLTAQDVSEVIAKYALDANTPEVLEKLRGTYKTREQFQLTMADLAYTRSTKPPSSPSAASTLTGAPAQNKDEQTKLQDEFDNKAKGLRGIDIVNLKMEYRQKGLNIN